MDSFRRSHFDNFSNMILDKTGISIPISKQVILKSKLYKAMSKLKIDSYDEYFKHLSNNQHSTDYQEFLNLITTNTTEFFREKQHFDFIRHKLSFILENNLRINKNSEIRVWCAASSSGQEAVTIAIMLKECFESIYDIKILATDISTKVLQKASLAIYPINDCSEMPEDYLKKYFNRIDEGYIVKDEIRSCIKYRLFNLMDPFVFKKGFDIIFCRNVMIYFDRGFQEVLINKFYNQLVDGGLLFIGHSESLISVKHKYSNIGASIYMK